MAAEDSGELPPVASLADKRAQRDAEERLLAACEAADRAEALQFRRTADRVAAVLIALEEAD